MRDVLDQSIAFAICLYFSMEIMNRTKIYLVQGLIGVKCFWFSSLALSLMLVFKVLLSVNDLRTDNGETVMHCMVLVMISGLHQLYYMNRMSFSLIVVIMSGECTQVYRRCDVQVLLQLYRRQIDGFKMCISFGQRLCLGNRARSLTRKTFVFDISNICILTI